MLHSCRHLFRKYRNADTIVNAAGKSAQGHLVFRISRNCSIMERPPGPQAKRRVGLPGLHGVEFVSDRRGSGDPRRPGRRPGVRPTISARLRKSAGATMYIALVTDRLRSVLL